MAMEEPVRGQQRATGSQSDRTRQIHGRLPRIESRNSLTEPEAAIWTLELLSLRTGAIVTKKMLLNLLIWIMLSFWH